MVKFCKVELKKNGICQRRSSSSISSLICLVLMLSMVTGVSCFSTVNVSLLARRKANVKGHVVCEDWNENDDDGKDWNGGWSRKDVLKQCRSLVLNSSLLYASSCGIPRPASAASTEGIKDSRVAEYMKERVLNKDVIQMANIGGLQVTDIFYPSWFQGVWDVASKTIDISAPCGMALFGGGDVSAYQRAIDKEVGETLSYKARFLSNNNDHSNVVADREYNVASIVTATMKKDSPNDNNNNNNNNAGMTMMDIRSATPHLFTCYLGGNAFRVDMLESQRAQSSSSAEAKEFVCSEIVQQIVTSTQQQQQRIKLVETTTIYTYQADGSILANQKTFTYLVPSQNDMMALQQWQLAKNRAIDIRTYQVTYTKSTLS